MSGDVLDLEAARRKRRPPLPTPPAAIADWLLEHRRVTPRRRVMAMLSDASSHSQAPTIEISDPAGKGGRLNSTAMLTLGVLRSARAVAKGRTHAQLSVADVAEAIGGKHEDTARRALHRLVRLNLVERHERHRTLDRPERLSGVLYPAGAVVNAACVYGLAAGAYELGLEATRAKGRKGRRPEPRPANPAGELAGVTLSGLPSLREPEPLPPPPELDPEIEADVAQLGRHLELAIAEPSHVAGLTFDGRADRPGTPGAIGAATCDPKDLRVTSFRSNSSGREPSRREAVPFGRPEADGGVPVPSQNAAAPADAGAGGRAPRPDGREIRASAAPASPAPLRALGAEVLPVAIDPRAPSPGEPAEGSAPRGAPEDLPDGLRVGGRGGPGESSAVGACDAPDRPSPALPDSAHRAPLAGPRSVPGLATHPPSGNAPPPARGTPLPPPRDLDAGAVSRAELRRALLELDGGALLEHGERSRWRLESASPAGPPSRADGALLTAGEVTRSSVAQGAAGSPAVPPAARGPEPSAPAGERPTSANVPRGRGDP